MRIKQIIKHGYTRVYATLAPIPLPLTLEPAMITTARLGFSLDAVARAKVRGGVAGAAADSDRNINRLPHLALVDDVLLWRERRWKLPKRGFLGWGRGWRCSARLDGYLGCFVKFLHVGAAHAVEEVVFAPLRGGVDIG